MIQYLVKHLTKNFPARHKSFPPCGRDVCYCLKYLDLKDEQNKHFYESCLTSWLHYKEGKYGRNHWF